MNKRTLYFKDRAEVGRLLAHALKEYKKKDVVVYAIPRGGVEVAVEIARYLKAPMELIITKKIGHPQNPEYAVAAITDTGHLIGNTKELLALDEDWIEAEVERQKAEIIRRKELFQKGREEISPVGKTAILVDDGVATGLSLRAGVKALKDKSPKKIIVAVPVMPWSTAQIVKKQVDKLVAINIPHDEDFLGSIGEYYQNFPQVSDSEVTFMLNSYEDEGKRVFFVKNKGEHEFYGYDEP